MNPLRRSLNPNIRMAKRQITIDLSRLANVCPDMNKKSSHGRKPRRNFSSSTTQFIIAPF
jgi:hypothetical protein